MLNLPHLRDVHCGSTGKIPEFVGDPTAVWVRLWN
jgi:hypothetical protein